MTDSTSVTISLLPVSLSVVHVPRCRLRSLSHPLLRPLLLPTPAFLNVTCNEIELSMFAEHHVLKEFEPIARKDAHKLKVRGRERATQAKEDRCRKREWQPIEFSSEKWNVLQIDSHSDRLDNSGARVHELSAPLAAAGISILYQSSYMSDFIFVKEHRLSEVMALLASAGFDLYSSDPQNLTSQLSTLTSPILSPLANVVDDTSSIHLLDLGAPLNSISSESGAVLSRSRSSTDANLTSSFASQLQISSLHDQVSPSTKDRDVSHVDPSEVTPSPAPRPSLARSQSHSPSACDVRVLQPDLTCIGLAEDNTDLWTLKLIKLLAFPDLIDVPRSRPSRRSSADSKPPSVVLELSTQLNGLDEELGAHINSFSSSTESDCESGSNSDGTTRVGQSSPGKDPSSRFSSESPIFDLDQRRPWDDREDSDENYEGSERDDESSEEDGYYSASPNPKESPAEPQSELNNKETPMHTSKPSLPHLDIMSSHARERSSSFEDGYSRPCPLVPFFSFTRTPEGSSLTAPVDFLATLFPPSERHMVICSDELDVLDSRAASPESEEEEDDDVDEDGPIKEPQGTLKCLQLDLRKFGLDKHGLVNRFSRTLEDNGINHMYSSTYKTANLLVDKAHANRAQALLRSC